MIIRFLLVAFALMLEVCAIGAFVRLEKTKDLGWVAIGWAFILSSIAVAYFAGMQQGAL